jgi:hypothetical protein
MKATRSYEAKRVLFDRLAAYAAGANESSPLWPAGGKPVQISYDYPGRDLRDECVYGGGVRFTQSEAGHDGTLAMRLETITLSAICRVVARNAGSARTGDQRIEDILDILGDFLAREPDLGDGFTFSEIVAGQGDYFPADTERTSTLGVQIVVWAYLF